MENELKEFIEYNGPKKNVGVIVGVVLAIGGVYLFIYSGSLYGVAGVLAGIGFVIASIMEKSRYDKRLNEMKKSGELSVLMSDFRGGSKAFKDRLILGENYLIGRDTGVFLRYDKIAQIYQTIHRTNFIEDGRTITVVTTEGKYKDLCNLQIWGKSNDELDQVFEYIVSRNPSVKVGYN